MAFPTNDIYATLGVRPQLGRLPVPDDEDRVALISDRLWSTWFGRDPAVVGKTLLRLRRDAPGDRRHAAGVQLPERRDAALGGRRGPAGRGSSRAARRSRGRAHEAGRHARAARRRAHAALEGASRRASAGPPTTRGSSSSTARSWIRCSTASSARRPRTSLWVLLGAVTVVLLIACANVANLFLVRAEGRRRSLAVRRAIGASRAQLVRLQMTEAFLVALLAGGLAVILSAVTLPLFLRAAPEGIPRLGLVRLDLATLAAAFGLVVVAALACGAIPSLHASSPDLGRLRDGSRGSTGRRHLGRDVLVVGQTALALVLLIGSALLVQSFQRLRNVDPGYETADIYTFQFAPEQQRLTDGPAWGRFHLDFMDRLRALPGVTAVGVVNNIPLDEGTGTGRFLTDSMAAEGGGALLDQNFSRRRLLPRDGDRRCCGDARSPPTKPSRRTAASSSASRRPRGCGPIGMPFGQRIRRTGDTPQWFTVVGVVEDVKQNDWRDAGEAVVYFPLTGPTPTAWAMGSPAYVVKSPRAASLGREVRELVRQVAPEAPVYREFTMEFLAQRSMVQLSFTMLTLGVVSALAMILGAVGLYGVLAYVVAERTREIGVRMALGATAGAVRRLVVSQGAKVVLVGAVVGVVAALASTRL